MSDRSAPPSGSRTDIGRVRQHNEDSLIVAPPLYVVADGMGGHEAGEVASEIAVETIAMHAPRHADAQALGRAVRAANRAVFKAVGDGLGKSGMGTTVTAAVVEDLTVAIAQVGDSRAYLVHHGVLQRITRDHSLVAELIEQGRITEAEARYHPNRSIITRALGSDPAMHPDLFEIDAGPGDRLLLCSDGLSGMLEDEQIAALLLSIPDPQEAADALVDAANEAGGHDNITAVVVDIVGDEQVVQKRRGRRTAVATIAWTIAFVALLAAAFMGVRAYARSSAYLIDENGHVALHRGLPGSFLGLTLDWPVSGETTIPVESLPASVQRKLKDGIRQPSVESGMRTLDVYRSYADDAQEELLRRSSEESVTPVEEVPVDAQP